MTNASASTQLTPAGQAAMARLCQYLLNQPLPEQTTALPVQPIVAATAHTTANGKTPEARTTKRKRTRKQIRRSSKASIPALK